MPGHTWTAKEGQDTFLESRLPAYRELQPLKQYTHFWARLFEDWFKAWPEELELFPDKEKDEPLTKEETEQLGKAQKARRNQLRTWYRYRTSPTKNKRAAMTSKKITTVETRTRLPTKEEVFSALYYDEMIKPSVMARIQEENAATPGQKLNIVKSVRKEIFNGLSDDLLAEVEDALAQKVTERENRKMSINNPTPEDYKRAIEECPAVLRQFFDALTMRTGWAFTILMGGPDPRKNGDITSCSFHIGENRIGNNFNEAHPTFAETFMSSYTNFLETVYQKGSPGQAQNECKEETNVADNDTGSSDGVNKSCNVSGSELYGASRCDDITQHCDVSDTLNSHDVESTELRDNWHNNQSASTVADTAGDTSGRVYREDGPMPNSDSESGQFSDTSRSLPISSNAPDKGITAFVQGHCGTSDTFLTEGSQNTALPDALNWQSNNNTSNNTGAGFSYHFPTVMSMAPDPVANGVGAGSWVQMDNFGMNGVGGMNGGNHYTFGNNTGWDKQSTLDMSYGPECGERLIMSLHQGFSLDGTANIVPSDASGPGQSNQNDANGQGQHSIPPFLPLPPSFADLQHEATPCASPGIPECLENETTGSSAPVNPDTTAPPSSATKDVTGPRNQSERSSRFGRTIIPSTRLEKMNAIGSSKENIRLAIATPPSNEWLILVKEHLLQLNLGEEWRSCVKVWLTLEESLDYGAKTKGTLPLTKQRPEEWAKWVSKARHGVRQYHVMPAIKDIELFGNTFMKWWHKIQPHFRQNGGELLPLPNLTEPDTDSDPWVSLRKGGPNGLLVIILLLSWWGQSAVSGTSTADQWRDTAADVQRVLQTMMVVSSKRAAPNNISVQVMKR